MVYEAPHTVRLLLRKRVSAGTMHGGTRNGETAEKEAILSGGLCRIHVRNFAEIPG
jgi:hypothetical protein